MPTTTASEMRGNECRQHEVADWVRFTRRQAHEIRNPLNAIRMQVAVIRHKMDRPSAENLQVARDQLDRLDQEVLQIESLVKGLLEFGCDRADDDSILADIIGDES